MFLDTDKMLLSVLVMGLCLMESAAALKCYACAKIKVGHLDTCSDPSDWKEVTGEVHDSMCRVLKMGGEIVAMGLVREKLCKEEAISLTRRKMM